MYQIIFNIGRSLFHDEFKREEELLRFVNGLSTEEVNGSIIIKGEKKQLIRTEKGWRIDGTI